MTQTLPKQGDLVVLPQDSNLYKTYIQDSEIKTYQFDTIKEKPKIAIFIKNFNDDFCEVIIEDQKIIVNNKDIYLAEGTKYVS
jgi:hypothetical protein